MLNCCRVTRPSRGRAPRGSDGRLREGGRPGEGRKRRRSEGTGERQLFRLGLAAVTFGRKPWGCPHPVETSALQKAFSLLPSCYPSLPATPAAALIAPRTSHLAPRASRSAVDALVA